METRYKEIFRLRDMLASEDIPFEFEDRSESPRMHSERYELYQVGYPHIGAEGRVCSAIEGSTIWGSEDDKLEIMGLLTPEEGSDEDDVIGHLTAEEVFHRISRHWWGLWGNSDVREPQKVDNNQAENCTLTLEEILGISQ